MGRKKQDLPDTVRVSDENGDREYTYRVDEALAAAATPKSADTVSVYGEDGQILTVFCVTERVPDPERCYFTYSLADGYTGRCTGGVLTLAQWRELEAETAKERAYQPYSDYYAVTLLRLLRAAASCGA